MLQIVAANDLHFFIGAVIYENRKKESNLCTFVGLESDKIHIELDGLGVVRSRVAFQVVAHVSKILEAAFEHAKRHNGNRSVQTVEQIQN